MTQRVAYVTGGSRGIGAGIAKALAGDGYDVAISYARNEKAAEETVAEIRAMGRRAMAICCDGEGNGNRAAIQRVVRDLGRIDALVCNAGVYPHGDVSEMTDAQVDAVLGLNVRAVMIEAIEASSRSSMVFSPWPSSSSSSPEWRIGARAFRSPS